MAAVPLIPRHVLFGNPAASSCASAPTGPFSPTGPSCGVDICGPSGLVTLLESIPCYWTPQAEPFAARISDHRTEAGRALQAKGIPVTCVLYPDEGHGFVRPENELSFNAIAEALLARCLGGRAEPIGSDLQGSSLQVRTGAEEVPGLPEALG